MRQALIYLWAFPTTFVGLLFLPLALIGGGDVSLARGVLEIHGRWIALFLRRCVPIPGGASAMTLGHVVMGCDQFCLDSTRAHERIHVRQCERWGPLFIPAYLLASVIVRLRGLDGYRDNPFECQAYASERRT